MKGDVAAIIRAEADRRRREGLPLVRPEPPDLFDLTGGQPEDAVWLMLVWLDAVHGRPRRQPASGKRRRRRKNHGRGAYHRWTDHQDELVVRGDVPVKVIAAELGVTEMAVHKRRYYLRRSRYAPRVA